MLSIDYVITKKKEDLVICRLCYNCQEKNLLFVDYVVIAKEENLVLSDYVIIVRFYSNWQGKKRIFSVYVIIDKEENLVISILCYNGQGRKSCYFYIML